MLKYAIYCDLVRLKCDHKQFGDFLAEYIGYVVNHDDRLWFLDIDDSTPFYFSPDNISADLVEAGYADAPPDVILIKCDSVIYLPDGH